MNCVASLTLLSLSISLTLSYSSLYLSLLLSLTLTLPKVRNQKSHRMLTEGRIVYDTRSYVSPKLQNDSTRSLDMSHKQDDYSIESVAQYETENRYILSEKDLGTIEMNVSCKEIRESSSRLVLPDLEAFAMTRSCCVHREKGEEPFFHGHEWNILS